MRHVLPVVLAVSLVTVFGCVTTKEYNARLADISSLKNDVASLQDALAKKQAEKDGLAADLAKLRSEHDALAKKSSAENAELTKQNKALADDNANCNNVLKAKKGELNEKLNELLTKLTEKEKALAAKDAELDVIRKQLAALTQEKEALTQEKERSIAEMKKTYDSLMGEMNQEIKKGEITITQLKDKLSVNLVEQILFDSGSADIKKEGKKVLDRVAEILKKVTDKQVRVEGHTDNVPISSRLAAKFPTNWELSTARATTVARYIQDKGIDPKLLSAAGYSEYRPVASNDTVEGKAKNRRIEIALIPKEADRATGEGQK